MTRLCITLAATMLMAGCEDSHSRYDREFELNKSTFDAETMQMIRKDTGLAIPEGAQGLNFYYRPPIDPAFLARIELPSESGESIERQLAALKETHISVTGGLAQKVVWWQPAQGRVILDKQVFNPDNGRMLHAVLTIESERLILYIEWST